MEAIQTCDNCLLVKGGCEPDCVFRPLSAQQYHFMRQILGRERFHQLTRSAVSLEERNERSRTLIEECILRSANPVGGCFARLVLSQEQVHTLEEEVDTLKGQVDNLEVEIQTLTTLFFLKTKGDLQPEEQKIVTFNNVLDFARANLPSVHPAHLSLSLSIASYHDERGARDLAREIAQQAITSAGDVNTVFEGAVPQEVTTLINLLQEKLDLWNRDH